MLEYVVVGILVILAGLFTVRKLSRQLSGTESCCAPGERSCHSCFPQIAGTEAGKDTEKVTSAGERKKGLSSPGERAPE